MRLHNHPSFPAALRVYKTRAHPGQRCAYDILGAALAPGALRNSRVITAYNFFLACVGGHYFRYDPRTAGRTVIHIVVSCACRILLLIGDITGR